MDKNKAVVFVAGIFTWGMVTIVRTAYFNRTSPVVNIVKDAVETVLPEKKSKS